MIEVPDPPAQQGCASCMSPLVWLYSYRTGRTFSAVPTGPASFDVHGCRHAQDITTWRALPKGDPPTAEYVAAKEALKNAPKGDGVKQATVCDRGDPDSRAETESRSR